MAHTTLQQEDALGSPSPAPTDRVKVLYIGSQNRSGSTILGRLLGEIPGCVHVGELENIWLRGFQENRLCGCGKPFNECPFWQEVFDLGWGGMDKVDFKRILALKSGLERLRLAPRLYAPVKSAADKAALDEYTPILATLYRAIRDVSGARVVVDGSKHPTYSYVLGQTAGVDLRLLHLVRDSRAVAHSYQRKKKNPAVHWKEAHFQTVSPWRAAVQWNVVNSLLRVHHAGTRYLFMRYEDVARDPQSAIARLWSLLDEPAPNLDFLAQSPMHLGVNHTVAGNPDRFNPEVRVRPDTEWREKMNPKQRAIVTALTFPMLLQYGYLGRK